MVVAPDDHIIYILAGEDHQDALVQRENRIVASLKVVDDIVSPDANIEEVSLCLGLLEGLNMAIVQQVEASLNEDDFVGGLRFTIVAEMHHSSGGGQELRVRNTDSLILSSRCSHRAIALYVFLDFFMLDSSNLFHILT